MRLEASDDWICRIDGTKCSPYAACRKSGEDLGDIVAAQADKGGRKFDDGKLAYHLVPMDALDEVVKRFTHGAVKYAPGNWQKVDDAVERYSAALMRHYSAYRQGERADPEASGLSHIGAVAWNALVLTWFALRGFEPSASTGTVKSGMVEKE
jgi:hypothetical protein